MYGDNCVQLLDQLNPTFLMTWKGTRLKDEENYHNHDYTEMAFVLSGHGRYRIDDVYYDVGEGDLILLNVGQRHQALVVNPADPTTEFFVGFSDFRFPNLPENHLPGSGETPIIHTTGELRQKMFKLCASMTAENNICQAGRYLMLKSYLVQMLVLLLREQSKPIPINTDFSFRSVNKKYVVEQLENYFEEHYTEKISLDQIAENMYLSPYYISRIFKSETGDTPIHHLINIRLERAKELLERGGSGSVQEIAAAVGYDDACHFSKVFKKKYGIPPSKIMK